MSASCRSTWQVSHRTRPPRFSTTHSAFRLARDCTARREHIAGSGHSTMAGRFVSVLARLPRPPRLATPFRVSANWWGARNAASFLATLVRRGSPDPAQCPDRRSPPLTSTVMDGVGKIQCQVRSAKYEVQSERGTTGFAQIIWSSTSCRVGIAHHSTVDCGGRCPPNIFCAKPGQPHFPMGTDILTCRRGRRCDGQECLDFALCTLHFSLCTQLEHANCHSRISVPQRSACRIYQRLGGFPSLTRQY